MQTDDDYYCGLRCLKTAAVHFGLSGRERREWKAWADENKGIGKTKLVEIAKGMGMEVERGRALSLSDLTDIELTSIWLARIWADLPCEDSRTGRSKGAHYVLVLASRRSHVTIGDPYPQPSIASIRDVDRSDFESAWQKEKNWAIRLQPQSRE